MKENRIRNDKIMYMIAFFGNFSLERAIWMIFLVSKGFSLLEISIAQALLNGAMIVGEFPTGLFGDKYGRKKSMIIGRIISIIYLFGMLFAENQYIIYIIFILYGFGLTFMSGTDEALLYDSLKLYGEEENASKVGGTYGAIITFVTSIAIIIGGALQLISWNFIFFASIAFQVIALLITFKLKEVRFDEASETKKITDYIKDVKNVISSSSSVVTIFCGYAFINAVFSIYFMYAQEGLEVMDLSVLVISIIFFIASLLSTIIASKIYVVEKKFSSKHIILFSLVFTLIGYIALCFHVTSITILAFFVLNIMFYASDPVFFGVINSEIPSKDRASLLSAVSFLCSIVMTIMSLIIGGVSHVIEINIILAIMGIFFTVISTILMNRYFHLKK